MAKDSTSTIGTVQTHVLRGVYRAHLVTGGAKLLEREHRQDEVLVVQEGVEGGPKSLLNAALAQVVSCCKEAVEAANEVNLGAG